jgi:hypothetical protein
VRAVGLDPGEEETVKENTHRIISEFERDVPTQVFALFRVLFVASVFMYTTTLFHGRYVPEPRHRQVVSWLMMFASWTSFTGVFTRFSTGVFALCWAYLYLRWGVEARAEFAMQDAFVLQGLCVLALAPSGRSLSVDRWWAARRGTPKPQVGSGWTQWLGVASLSCMYAFLAKEMLGSSWLGGFELEHLLVARLGSSDALSSAPGLIHLLAVGCAWAVLLVVAGLSVVLWLPKWRWPCVAVGLSMHLLVWILVGGWPHTLAVMCMYAVVLPAEDVRDFFETVFDLPPRGVS